MNSFVRIGGALALGITIVLWSFSARSAAISEAELGSSVVVTTATERAYIPPEDNDGDGVSDWEQALAAVSAFETVTLPSEKPAAEAAEAYVPPDTFTGKFAQAFFANFMKSEMRGEQFFSKETVVNGALQAIEGAAKSQRYSRASITTTADSLAAIRAYGNEVAGIIIKHGTNLPDTNEAELLKKALENNDKTGLAQIEASRATYELMIREILQVSVPTTLATEHLALLNAFQTIHDDIAAMTVAFDDPLQTLARVAKYQSNVAELSKAFQNIGNTLVAQGITYAEEEAGVFFYLFTM